MSSRKNGSLIGVVNLPTTVSATGIWPLSYVLKAINDSIWPVNPGQQEYTTAGTYSWVAPSGVTSVSVVTVGAGSSSTWAFPYIPGGSGGGLGWKNNIAVTPGQSYTVVVGALSNSTGGTSYFINTSTVAGFGGQDASTLGSNTEGTVPGGTFVGDGGGNGGPAGVSGSGSGGGGGAGGYTGAGGGGRSYNSNTGAGYGGSGGGGAGGGDGGVGGGVGLLGQGANGTYPGGAGSGGSGALYGGGGSSGGGGGGGAVRIIWGQNRAFPSTNTGNL